MPAILWHYTDSAGFEGIVKASHLRLGDARFLNDRTERRYGFDLAVRICEERAADADPSSLIAAARSSLVGLPSISNLYICSLSQRRDSVSQWQRYAADGLGYCIGFDTQQFRDDVLAPAGLSLRKMIYSPREQQRFLRRALERTLDEHERAIAEYEGDDRERYVRICGFLVAYRIEQHSLQLKHESFRDEVEWRLIRTVTSDNKREPVPSFSTRGPYIKPFIEIAVGTGATALPIAKVICGPRLDGDLAVSSAKHFLDSTMYRNVDVTWSELHEIWR